MKLYLFFKNFLLINNIHILGLILLVLITKIPYGILFIIGNITLFGILSWYLMDIKKSRKITMDQNVNGVVVLLSYMSIGSLFTLYHIYKFYKYPITRDMTDEEYENIQVQKSRHNKLNKIGI